MLSNEFLYQQNEFMVMLVIFLILVATGEGSYLLAQRRRASKTHETTEATQTHLSEVQTAIFAVLGLLLAFTFSMAVSRFDSRKQALVEETNAIGTAYLRIQLLPPGQQAAAAEHLRQYVDARLASARPNWYLDTGLRDETSRLQQGLWTQAVAAAQQDPRSVSAGLYVQSLNDMFDAQSTRDAARLNQLPATGLYLLLAISVVAVGTLGYRAGLGSGRSLVGAVLLSLVIALLIGIIIDLDHPYQGLITISQQGLIQLRQSMGNSP